MPTLPPLYVADLFPDLSKRLVELLWSLTADDWQRPTSSSRRTVKDIVSHLLDGSLRRLSLQRDGYASPDENSRLQPDEPLLQLLTRLNADWERATRRLSPTVLTGLLVWADQQLAELFKSLDPFAPAIFPVSWVGENESRNWMDIAREYTEKWHHTQQVFEATGRPSTITVRRLFHPCLDAFLRALPFTYRDVPADIGTTVAIEVTGAAGGIWHVQRDASGWRPVTQPVERPQSTVTLDELTLWKLVTKRRSRAAELAEFPDIRIVGDAALGGPVLDMVSMIA